MIEYTEKEITMKQKTPAFIICDVCGKKYDYEHEIMEIQEFHQVRFTGGYASVFGDETRVECDICQNCLKKMIGEFCRTEDLLFGSMFEECKKS